MGTGQKVSRDCSRGLFLVLFSVVVFIVSGCTPPPKEFVLDSAGHRVTNGFSLLELGRIDDARREFRIALSLDPHCCEAYRGIGLSLGMQERFDDAFKAMGEARSCAKTDRAKALADVGFMRLVTLKKGKRWVDRAERFFLKALDEDPNNFDAYYYMGMAYRQAGMLPKAVWAFRKAVKIDGPFQEKAKEALVLVTKVLEAKPQTELGRTVAFKSSLTRGEVAALFVRELDLPGILRVHDGKANYTLKPKAKVTVPQDTKQYPYRAEIVKILRFGIQGLTLFPDGSFSPEVPVSRSDFATMLADIIRKLKLARGMNTRGENMMNPFEDVDQDAPYFADVILCTRVTHMLEPERGSFEPMELVSGADVLLAIRRLKDAIGHNKSEIG